MDQSTREKVGSPAFGAAVDQKVRAIRDALEGQYVKATAPLIFYVGGVRVAADWSGPGPANVVRVRVGAEDDAQPVEVVRPAPWALSDAFTQADVDYLLAGVTPEPPPVGD